MAALCVKPVGYALGAEVTGVDLAQRLDAATLEAIRAAWLKHLVLVFPGQQLSPGQQVAFSRNFGELDTHDSQPFNRHPDLPEVLLLTNRPVNGKPSQTYNAGQNWHTDLSYTVRPAKGTTLYCVEKPSVGGDTMFASMYRAYETLSDKLKEILEGLEAVHDVNLVEGLEKRDPAVVAEFRRLNPPVVHPAVRTHPETGRRALYVNARVRRFVGMTDGESRPLIDFLCQHSISPRFVYRHRWSEHDLVMWDNRCLVHLAVGDYDPTETRHMTRTSFLGDYVGRLADPAGPPAPTHARPPVAVAEQVAALRD
jgi:taurine dioxygenase